MASMAESSPLTIRDYVQGAIVDQERWLIELDAWIDESLREMDARVGHGLDEVCDAIVADIGRREGDESRR